MRQTTPSDKILSIAHKVWLAGLLEIGWAVGLKYTDGFTQFWPTIATAISLVESMVLLGLSLRSFHLGPYVRCGPASVQSEPR